MNPTVTLIVNTAQQPEFLARVLAAVARQSDAPEELIIAEDGHDPETREAVGQARFSGRTVLQHVTQEKVGFRRSRILNIAIAQSCGEYVIFLDGDTIPHPDFVGDHRRLARKGFFVQGHRALVSEQAACWFGAGDFDLDRRRAFLGGDLKGWKHVYRWIAPFKRVLYDLDGVRGCNLGIWREDLLRVNGYDEGYVGWGCEDLDLASRLFHNSIWRLDVRGRALCYHLWHAPADRTNLAMNQSRLDGVILNRALRCERGLDDHLERVNRLENSVALRPECEPEKKA